MCHSFGRRDRPQTSQTNNPLSRKLPRPFRAMSDPQITLRYPRIDRDRDQVRNTDHWSYGDRNRSACTKPLDVPVKFWKKILETCEGLRGGQTDRLKRAATAG